MDIFHQTIIRSIANNKYIAWNAPYRTSLLIIPAATARKFSKNPEQMAVFAVISGMLAVVLGLGASYLWDTPAGPSIVIAASGLFLVSQTFRNRI